MALTLKQRAKRALVTLLLSLASAYGLQLSLTRESADVDVTRAFRRVSVKVHPDKGGAAADAQRLNAARDAWLAANRGAKAPGRPACPQAEPPTPSAAVANGREGFRIRSEAVLLTYQSWPAAEAPAVWQRFCAFVAGSATAWTVKHWAATMEHSSCGDCHLHLMLQFTAALDSGSVRFIFEGVRPNQDAGAHRLLQAPVLGPREPAERAAQDAALHGRPPISGRDLLLLRQPLPEAHQDLGHAALRPAAPVLQGLPQLPRRAPPHKGAARQPLPAAALRDPPRAVRGDCAVGYGGVPNIGDPNIVP